MIMAGRVTVNGRVVRELGARVDPESDVIAVDGELSELSRELLRDWPDVRVLLLARDGREGFLWELRPHRVVLGELSIETLRESVRRLAHQEVA